MSMRLTYFLLSLLLNNTNKHSIYRFAFQEIDSENLGIWFTLDYTADLLYILDIAFHFRTGYLDDGVLQTDSIKLRITFSS
jgi:hypothetical protein